ncbi:hypothetical protein KAR48_01235 [bacterium]|nr:hypothetical protein [bacterium]
MTENKNIWNTDVTLVEPNNLVVRGYKLTDIVEKADLIEAACIIISGERPNKNKADNLRELAITATRKPLPAVHRNPAEDISKTLQKYILCDEELASFNPPDMVEKAVFALGRFGAYLAEILGNTAAVKSLDSNAGADKLIYRAVTGKTDFNSGEARMLEAVVTASMDHGVTPPSAQATLIASTARASYEVALAQGVGAITDMHGGAGEKAAEFFMSCVARAETDSIQLEEATRLCVSEAVEAKVRIKGMGHRVHSQDPRRDILWSLSDSAGLSSHCVAVSKLISDIFENIRGKKLPINVDGVIGAVIADMGIDPKLAKALFIYGRIMGLSAHFDEELKTQKPMRRIDFTQAQYTGPKNLFL